jgi:hypothetical protein
MIGDLGPRIGMDETRIFLFLIGSYDHGQSAKSNT